MTSGSLASVHLDATSAHAGLAAIQRHAGPLCVCRELLFCAVLRTCLLTQMLTYVHKISTFTVFLSPYYYTGRLHTIVHTLMQLAYKHMPFSYDNTVICMLYTIVCVESAQENSLQH